MRCRGMIKAAEQLIAAYEVQVQATLIGRRTMGLRAKVSPKLAQKKSIIGILRAFSSTLLEVSRHLCVTAC